MWIFSSMYWFLVWLMWMGLFFGRFFTLGLNDITQREMMYLYLLGLLVRLNMGHLGYSTIVDICLGSGKLFLSTILYRIPRWHNRMAQPHLRSQPNSYRVLWWIILFSSYLVLPCIYYSCFDLIDFTRYYFFPIQNEMFNIWSFRIAIFALIISTLETHIVYPIYGMYYFFYIQKKISMETLIIITMEIISAIYVLHLYFTSQISPFIFAYIHSVIHTLL